MANLIVLDGNGSTKIMCATGEGSLSDPLVVEHKDSKAIDQLKELSDALGKPDDITAGRYQITGNSEMSASPFNITELLKLNTELLSFTLQTLEGQGGNLGLLAGSVGPVNNFTVADPTRLRDQLDGNGNLLLDVNGQPLVAIPYDLLSLAKGVLQQLYLLRTGVTT